MKHSRKYLLGYLAVALAFMMIGSAATLSAAPAQAENVTTVVHTSPFTAAVADVRDSVVGINNYQIVRYANYGGWMWGPGRNYEIMEEEQLAGSGSGVVISEDGHVLTNYHVVEDAVRLTVTVNGEEHPATLVAVDETLDIAIVQVKGLGLEPVVLGDSDTLMVGDWAICIGNPLNEQFTGTVTAGIVSGLNRSIANTSTDKYGRRETITNTMIQVDAAINSGNSGGGMFSVTGELMGIPTLKYTGSSFYGASIDNIGMCIPINSAKPLINAVLSGEIQPLETPKQEKTPSSANTLLGKPRMGITVTSMNAARQAVSSGALPKGVYVLEIEPGSPAEDAGLKPGDIIVDVNDNVITATDQLNGIIAGMKEGDVLQVKVYRVPGIETLNGYDDIPDGEYIDLEVTLKVVDAVKQ